MALAAELHRRLSSSEYGPPEKRQRLAVQVFESALLQVACKEESALETLCKLEDWEGLKECLQHKRFARAVLRPTFRKMLLQTCAKNTECSLLLLSDHHMANYLAARPQEFRNVCSSLFIKADSATVKAVVVCALRSPTPISLAPFVTTLAEVDLDDDTVRLVASVIPSEEDILTSLKDPINTQSAGLAARIVAAKYGKSDVRAERFVSELVTRLSDNKTIGLVLSALDTVENKEWLVKLFERILTDKHPIDLLSAFQPLPHLDLLHFESLLPKLVAVSGDDPKLDELLVESLVYAEKEQRAHKLIPKFLDGIDKEAVPRVSKFLDALTASALKWNSKHLIAAISGLIFYLEKHSDGYFLNIATPFLCHLLDASKAAQHNIPELVRDKMSGILENLSKILEKLSPQAEKCTAKKSRNAFLTSFLDLCLSYGELRLLILHYSEADCGTLSASEALLDFSLMLPFVKNWQIVATTALQIDQCRPLIGRLVDQKVRASTLLGVEMSAEQQTAAALMLASQPNSQLSISFDLLKGSLDKSSTVQVADSIASCLLQSSEHWTGCSLDNDVALALLRAMQEQKLGLGVLSAQSLKNLAPKQDPFSEPDVQPGEKALAFVSAFGRLRLTDEKICGLSAAALLAACFGQKTGWDAVAPVITDLLSSSKLRVNTGKIVAWLTNLEIDLDESITAKFMASLVGAGELGLSDMKKLEKIKLNHMTRAFVTHLLNGKSSPEVSSALKKLATANNIQLPMGQKSQQGAVSHIRTASVEQLTDLFKSKVVVDASMADAALGRLHQFNISDAATLKSVVVCINALLTSRTVLAMERLPVLQQHLQRVMEALVEIEDDEIAADIAHRLEGIGVAMYKHKKDVARVAAYFSADVLTIFEKKTLRPPVKVHLERYLQALLKLSDEHSDLFLLRTVSPACQQMLHAQLAMKRKVENFV